MYLVEGGKISITNVRVCIHNNFLKIIREFCYLRVLGQASDDMKIDSVMSSNTCSKNSALLHCS